ncbi:NTP transferase domain-containing protein [bacterium]|nr:NTP transferase domain-containing protein [bacterium]
MEKNPATIPSDTRVVIMAGGQGARLRPYTTVLPKPLLPVGDRPVLEHVLGRVAKAGLRRVTVSVGHLAELIQAFFGDGSRWDLDIDYAIEDRPLNTMGPLTLLDDLGENFFVMNGDILSDLDLRDLWREHLDSKAALTVATFRREVKIDFGVLRYNGSDRHVRSFEEKPVLSYDVSMGIYVLNRRCLDFILKGEPFGFDQLVLALLAAQERVHAHPHTGKWLDLGRPEDYDAANAEFAR